MASAEELAALEAYVAAPLRERTPDAHGWFQRSWASRLPAWLKLAKNRAPILAGLARLRARLPAWLVVTPPHPTRRPYETAPMGVRARRARRKNG